MKCERHLAAPHHTWNYLPAAVPPEACVLQVLKMLIDGDKDDERRRRVIRMKMRMAAMRMMSVMVIMMMVMIMIMMTITTMMIMMTTMKKMMMIYSVNIKQQPQSIHSSLYSTTDNVDLAKDDGDDHVDKHVQ